MIVSLWVRVARHAESTKNNKFTKSFQYFKESVKDEVDFSPPNECWRFLQSDTIKFAISLQHVKNEVSNAVDFLHAVKHESLQQIDTKIFWMG